MNTAYTGLIEKDGKHYYAKIGVLSGGWVDIDGDWYYFDEETKEAVSTLNNGFVTYEFEENGKLISGKWYTTEEGTKYYYGPDFYVATRTASVAWAEIDGNTYGFDRNGYRYEGPNYAKESNAPQYIYNFDDDGVYLGKFSGITDLRYFEDGVAVPLNKLIEYDGDYYYVQGNSVLATGTFKVVNGNNIVADNTYREFDKDGKMIVDPAVDGIVKEDGVLRYYINNVIQKGSGLVKVGDDYYYVRSNGELATGTYLVWNGNGFVEDQTYHEFGSDGKMIVESPKNGIVRDDDGVLRYYENGEVKGLSLLIEVDGDYYYVRSNGELAVNRYLAWNGNGIVEDQTFHEFDADGKMIS